MASTHKYSLLVLALTVGALAAHGQSREGLNVEQVPASSSQTSAGAAEDLSTHGSMFTHVTGANAPIGPGDLLEISVFDAPELTQRVRVNGAGKITLPLIGEIAVDGLSSDALRDVIAEKLVTGKLVRHPQVSVFVAEYAGQLVYITGEVARPGAYPLLRAHRLKDVIAVAGGPTARAGNQVTIARANVPDAHIAVDLSATDEAKSNPEIEAGDSVTVAQAGIVYVLGDVERPGGFILDRRSSMSIMQAVALAEGTKSSANTRKLRLIRKTQGTNQEIPVDLREILKAKSPDIDLQAGDILFVPGSATRGMGRRSIDTILATASGVAIYAYRP